MKFIDKETFFKYLDYWVKEEDKHLPPNDNWYVSVKITAEESEVEAIPMNWLAEYIWGADTHEEKRALRKMCKQWEKENNNADG